MWKRFNDLNSRFKKIKASPKSENEKKLKPAFIYFFNLILIVKRIF